MRRDRRLDDRIVDSSLCRPDMLALGRRAASLATLRDRRRLRAINRNKWAVGG